MVKVRFTHGEAASASKCCVSGVNASLILPKKKTLCLLIAAAAAPALCGQNAVYICVYVYVYGPRCLLWRQ